MRSRRTRAFRNRRGVEVLELILVLPVLLIVLVAAFEYALLMNYQAAITHSATVGAREAGKCPNLDIVVDAVEQVLEASCIAVDDAPGCGAGIVGYQILLEVGDNDTDGDGFPGPPQRCGDSSVSCGPPDEPEYLEPDEVRVTVCVALSATGFCNALEDWGFDLGDCVIRASSIVKLENP